MADGHDAVFHTGTGLKAADILSPEDFQVRPQLLRAHGGGFDGADVIFAEPANEEARTRL